MFTAAFTFISMSGKTHTHTHAHAPTHNPIQQLNCTEKWQNYFQGQGEQISPENIVFSFINITGATIIYH